MKLLVLIDSIASFIVISSLVAKQLGWVIKPNITPIAVKVANRIVVHSSSITNGLILSGI